LPKKSEEGPNLVKTGYRCGYFEKLRKYFTNIKKKKEFSADLVACDKDIRQSVENEGILLVVGKAADGVRAGGG
jgi:hypothetical protein